MLVITLFYLLAVIAGLPLFRPEHRPACSRSESPAESPAQGKLGGALRVYRGRSRALEPRGTVPRIVSSLVRLIPVSL
jgi:hypothetical protein